MASANVMLIVAEALAHAGHERALARISHGVDCIGLAARVVACSAALTAACEFG